VAVVDVFDASLGFEFGFFKPTFYPLPLASFPLVVNEQAKPFVEGHLRVAP
jgi:hypothetical protein